MFKKFKTRETENQITFEKFIDKYSKDYFISVDFHKSGSISVFIGSKKDKSTEQ